VYDLKSPPLRKDYAVAVRLYNQEGWTVAQLAVMFGISRWGMHKVLKVRGCTFRPKVSVAGRKVRV